MLFGLEETRANIRNRDGNRVFYLGKTDQLTSEARDWLTRERIEILPAQMARPQRYRLLSGGFIEEKPEHMTCLFGDVLVEKTHPRIAFRGAVDSLEAVLLRCAREVPKWEKELTALLNLVRQILRCEVMGEKLPEKPIMGLNAHQLREQSHRPQDFYGQAHFMPSVADGDGVLWLNQVRTQVRHTELMAVAAMPDREDILKALNRMSSAVYILMIREKMER